MYGHQPPPYEPIATLNRNGHRRWMIMMLTLFTMLWGLRLLRIFTGTESDVDSETRMIAAGVSTMVYLGLMSLLAWQYTRRNRHDLRLGASPAGLLLAGARGYVQVPWDAVTHLEAKKALIGGPRLRIKLHKNVGPQDPRVHTDYSNLAWSHARLVGYVYARPWSVIDPPRAEAYLQQLRSASYR